MKTRSTILLGGLLLYSSTVFSQNQTNNFILGIYVGDRVTIKSTGGIETQATLTFGVNTYYTSHFGIIREDGFNTILAYHPAVYLSHTSYRDYITLVKNNTLKIIDETPGCFKPIQNGPGVENQYNLDPIADQNNAKYNIDKDYDLVYSDPLFANTITAHSLGGEFAYFHWYAYRNQTPPYVDEYAPHDPNVWEYGEIPPQNLSDAIGHFKQKRDALGLSQIISFSSATHGGMIEGSTDTEGIYDSEDYVLMSGVNNPQKPDMFSEGSYFSHEFRNWATSYNYLGKFKSIDFASKHFNRVITEICMQQNDAEANYEYVYHSNPAIKNGNHLWFQAYTSIIHGSTGITFYGIEDAYKSTTADVNNKNYLNNVNNADRFQRTYAPEYYKNYGARLGRELRYLIDEGFLSTDPTTVLYNKTTTADPNCILPASTNYLPSTILAADARDYLAINGMPPSWNITNTLNRRDENYGLRYTIRTNGTDVIMIVSNPNPYSVHNVAFNFDYISNPVIRRANGVDVLFDDGSVSSVNSTSYKVETSTVHNRTSVDDNFDLPLTKKHHITFAANTKGFTSDFGPFDVKVYKFTSAAAPTSTDWVKVWSNNGNKNIGGWGPVAPTDKFLVGDFDNNGKEDLLCLTNRTSNNWVVMQEYNTASQSWDWKWANAGNDQLASDWTLNSSHRYYVGDFNGDSKSDILCVSGTNGWASIYTYSSNSWVKIWTNNGNSSVGGWSFQATDNFYVADFDGNGKANLLAMQASSASSGKWAMMQELNTGGTAWNSQWTNGGNNLLASDWPLDMAHKYYTGDFNGDGKAEIYCASGTNNYTNIYGYNNGFVWKWSNSGSPDNLGYSAGWPMPFKPNVEILSGNIDSDNKSELLFIDKDYTSYSALRAQSADINSTTGKLTANWTNSSSMYINDWPLREGNTRYYLIKASATESNKYLLAMKDYSSVAGCSSPDYLVSLYKVFDPLINYIGVHEDGVTEAPEEKSVLTEEVDFRIYPNPNNGLMNIYVITNSEKEVELELYSLEGNRVAGYVFEEGKKEMQIDQSKLAPGTYFAHLVSNNQTLSIQKLVIIK